MTFIRIYGLYFAWVLSLLGTLLSLYFSELEHLEPCRFCWFQRIALFPLALQLGIAAYRCDHRTAAIYCLPLCFAGLAAALMQSLILWIGIHGLCGPGISCRDEVIYFFGLIPFPYMSGIGFLFIGTLIWLSRREDAR